jgi:hypothetical protein
MSKQRNLLLIHHSLPLVSFLSPAMVLYPPNTVETQLQGSCEQEIKKEGHTSNFNEQR